MGRHTNAKPLPCQLRWETHATQPRAANRKQTLTIRQTRYKSRGLTILMRRCRPAWVKAGHIIMIDACCWQQDIRICRRC